MENGSEYHAVEHGAVAPNHRSRHAGQILLARDQQDIGRLKRQAKYCRRGWRFDEQQRKETAADFRQPLRLVQIVCPWDRLAAERGYRDLPSKQIPGQLAEVAVQADPEKAWPVGVFERPLPAAHQRKPAHCKRHGHGHSQPSINWTSIIPMPSTGSQPGAPGAAGYLK